MAFKSKKSKSEFIRSFPAGTAASAVVAAGKKAGVEFDEKYVYHVRSADNARAKKRRGKTAARVQAANNVVIAPEAINPHVESALRAAASEIGLSNAIQLLTDWRKAILGNLASA